MLILALEIVINIHLRGKFEYFFVKNNGKINFSIAQ